MGRSIKQKEIVYNTLKSLTTHPTIKELYDEIKTIDNTIGQATVYRNINKLYESGLIRKIQIGDTIDRYDGNETSHYHLICRKCKKIIDIFDNSIDKSIIEDISNRQGIKINNYELILDGICNDCNN